ncbi:sugar transferase [Thioclava sp. FR2]|uniref:sugar transferase n=1 Tax=Thioclava sp. FR2 TaxID=3445780 RepID=UPI003EB769BF
MSAVSVVRVAPPFCASRGCKRIFDLLLISLSLPVLLPTVILLAVAIKLISKGPVFFVQERVGENGRRFRMVKFRSMYPDAEERRAALLKTSERMGVCFKHRHDPRVTPIGRFLRRTSLDELPQLWNVFCGDMSLVGPRPALPEEVAQYSPRALERLNGLPGLTGLWQVSGRADIGFDQMVELDIAYLRTSGVVTDAKLIWRTFGAVFTARGAY